SPAVLFCPAPPRAGYGGLARVAADEDDEHFVAFVRDEPAAAILAGHHRGQPRPRLERTAAAVTRPRERDLHAPLAVGVLDVLHQRRVRAVKAAAVPARRT